MTQAPTSPTELPLIDGIVSSSFEEQQISNIEQMIDPETLRKQAFAQKLGNIVLGFEGDMTLINDPELAPQNRRERRQENRAYKKAEVVKDKQAAVSLMHATTGEEPFGKRRKIRSTARVLRARSQPGKSYHEKRAAVSAARLNPSLKMTQYQKTIARKNEQLNNLSERRIAKPLTQEDIDLLKVEKAFLELNRPLLTIGREYNDIAKDSNRKLASSNRTAGRSGLVGRVIRATRGRNLGKALQPVKERLDTKARDKAGKSRELADKAEDKRQAYAAKYAEVAQQRQDIADYLNSI